MLFEKLIIVLAVFFSYFLQTSIDVVRIAQIKPDFLLMLTIYFAIHKGPFTGLWIGFWGGLLQDINIGGIALDEDHIKYFIGVHALPKTLLGFFVGKFSAGIRKDNMLVSAVLLFFSSLFVGVFTFFLISVFHNAIAAQAFFSVVLPESIYNTLLGIFWLKFLTWALPTITEEQ